MRRLDGSVGSGFHVGGILNLLCNCMPCPLDTCSEKQHVLTASGTRYDSKS
jgi:hypothetical protein